MKVVIIGGVAGGATAAARLRRLNEKADIIIIERSGYISYANCGLPYYIGGKITRKESLTLQTPASFYKRFRIDARVRHEALAINKDEKTIKIRDLSTGNEYEESYDKLILAPGAKAIRPDIKGIDSSRVFTLKTVEDTYEIDEFIKGNNPARATIIGGGYIGLEMAENLIDKGIEVTVVQRGNHVMSSMDTEMARILESYMIDKGIDIRLNASVTEIVEGEQEIRTVIESKEDVCADMIILAAGVAPESTLAKMAGLTLGVKDAIVTNEYMQTSCPDIYAVGDAVQTKHHVTGRDVVIPLAGAANKQGRVAANHICGIKGAFMGPQGSAIMKMFDMTVATTGISKEAADKEGIDSDYVVLTSASHATYYPGAESMYMKVVFEKVSGRILGAQIVGFEGADKRIDVLATAIRANMTAYDLEELDLAYAPPYSSAKDPVNMAGYAICNIIEGIVKQVHWSEIANILEDEVLLDTRTEGEYKRGHVENSLHIPLDSLRENLDMIPKDKKIYVYCHSGLRSYVACRILAQEGYNCYNVSGGYGMYKFVY